MKIPKVFKFFPFLETMGGIRPLALPPFWSRPCKNPNKTNKTKSELKNKTKLNLTRKKETTCDSSANEIHCFTYPLIHR